ncbi:hypothetical protein [Fluviicola taffensis]|uniref:Tetratricopeptide TPR_1 repeat-containing protein n=1 Tax=Fluviicola taffensis (strain DSM 16823 / NCIMB 13979 / RW262) TaxID=755732 RepID=F2IE90_FLUTR|nr:hypothetical protein [Fluviicola taffensis]AEA42408.1 hypothetical protein Fluta_0400 [Fluviicola taffensis DSM 16823]
MRTLLLSFILFGFAPVFGQVVLGTYGAQQVFGAVSSLGREVVGAIEYKKSKEEKEQREAEFNNFIVQADGLFAEGKYSESVVLYNQALSLKQDQYPRDQIARCNAELARINREEYQLLIDKADSSYTQLNFDLAIENYNAALAVNNQQYPKDKIKEAMEDKERWGKIHFSGLLISDTREDDLSSRAYSNDPYSDFMNPGKYGVINNSLVYSNYQTLDGIAVPANMRLVIYSEPHFKGTVLVDVVGPAIINNITKKNAQASEEVQTREFSTPLQQIFPQTVRTWSVSDMKSWIKGSMEITKL